MFQKSFRNVKILIKQNKYPKCLREGLNPLKGLTFECLSGGFALLQDALLAGNFNK